jgi:hypothetical protein
MNAADAAWIARQQATLDSIKRDFDKLVATLPRKYRRQLLAQIAADQQKRATA